MFIGQGRYTKLNSIPVFSMQFGPGDGYLVSRCCCTRNVPNTNRFVSDTLHRSCRTVSQTRFVRPALNDSLIPPRIADYLYNWRSAPIDGAADGVDVLRTSNIGVVML